MIFVLSFSSTINTGYIRIIGNAVVTDAYFNVSGQNHSYLQETYDEVSSNGTFDESASKAYDGSYSTYATPEEGEITEIFWNYTKPIRVDNTSYWQVKDYNATVNLTIPNDCWSQSPLQLKVRQISNPSVVFDSLSSSGHPSDDDWTLSDENILRIAEYNIVDCSEYPGFDVLRANDANDWEYATTDSFDLSSYGSADFSFKFLTTSTVDGTGMEVDYSCDGGSTWVSAALRYGWQSTACNWYSYTKSVGGKCGTPLPSNFKLRYSIKSTNSNNYVFGKDVTIVAVPVSNMTWQCYDGSTWKDLRTTYHSRSAAHTYARAYEEGIHWHSYPSDAWLEVGVVNGTRDWNYTPEFNVTTERTSDFDYAITEYLSSCSLDDDGFCLVPFSLHSDTVGKIYFDNVNVTYTADINPISISSDVIQSFLRDSTGVTNIPINFTSESNGVLEVSNIKYKYAGGNQTYQVTAHNATGTALKTLDLTYYYSGYELDFPPGIDFIGFSPWKLDSKNVTPFGQTPTTPLFNTTFTGYGGKSMNFSININESGGCVGIKYSNTSTIPSDTNMYKVLVTEDAGIIQGLAGGNYGNDDNLWIRNRNTDARRSYVGVDLSSLSALSCSDMSLCVRSDSITTPDSSTNITYTYCSDSLTSSEEATITWTNQATTVTGCEATPFFGRTLDKYVEESLYCEDILSSFNDDADKIFTIKMQSNPETETSSPNPHLVLHSSDAASSTNHPYVVAFCGNSTVEQNTWKQITSKQEYLDWVGLWLWADLDCSVTSWNYWNPEYYFRACCDDCICDISTS